jgi:Flp pilus assembly protein TadG
MEGKVKKYLMSFLPCTQTENTKAQQRGVSTIEAAMVLPIFLLLLAGVADLSRLVYTGLELKNKITEAARDASQLPVVSSAKEDQLEGDVLKTVTALKLYNPSVTVSLPNMSNPAVTNKTVVITASGQFNFLFLRIMGVRSVNLTDSATVRYEWQANQP